MEEIDKFLDLRITEREAIFYLKWFLYHTLDNYLDQNTSTLLNAIKHDGIPLVIKDFMLNHEIHHKNRKEVIEALK